ncbi:transglycosylase SLT domain-containing protein [Methylotenera sp.]|uniref:transglycosylase SLT domain-containing protein n=1 Tax=Methylotenera sp. TaxID=2051956 RepID=UPI002724220B|nr:transglycosylase SLT domain-containing protein [Methylotenera sp.]MDO9206388.1 transglycosylase SLT domain-containing protein [Methylotenera sp.]MDO9392912.1 transglycosylase SLT domain-containing protein [Methylotenera sp.]MDP2070739.1 transglycosylase SLT domain-containing protein [Methylotenera sp.]MDP3004780.1 transglycosylase SLT domain-containing protein [Methylotenera sp.]MDP3307327.1 transglycosylase SLT domain-containing protein [Methylotenera sp.]
MLLTRLLLALVAITLSNQVFALSDQALFQHAREAYTAKNEIALAEDVAQLNTQQYLLAPYADYWLMLLKLEQARDEEVQNFLAQYVDMPFADRIRGEWLKKLGKQQNWGPFFEEQALFLREDIAVQCYALQGHALLGDVDVTSQVKELWLTSADLPSNCNQLFDELQKTGALSNEDIWARFRLALQDGKLNLAKNVITRLPGFDVANLKLLDRAYQSPQLILDKNLVPFKTRFGAEVNLYAVDRLARSKLESAISAYKKVQNQFESDNRAFAWGRIAYHAARGHHPKSISYYALADGAALDKEQLAWKVRAALRVQDWATVLSAITAMQAKQQEEGAWRYWKARALKEAGEIAESNAIFSKLSTERHYYGWLAAEELESMMSSAAIDYKVTDTEVTAIASQPEIKRALELQRLDMRWEAKAEWAWATRHFDDKQLLAAAEFALRQKWYDIAISTADNTKYTHNFNLRYPTPYRDLFKKSADSVSLDEAWVYGITRQESRFMHYAKSGVGASGLMQLMPATAKWVAKRMGMNGYNNSMIHEISTNIEFGTYYMRYALDLMGGQAVMATAGYNAGPSRAKRWMASGPLEAAIYIESIPFTETRQYVQKVMANAQLYAPRLGSKVQTLKSRLGIIPGSGKPEVIGEDNSDTE